MSEMHLTAEFWILCRYIDSFGPSDDTPLWRFDTFGFSTVQRPCPNRLCRRPIGISYTTLTTRPTLCHTELVHRPQYKPRVNHSNEVNGGILNMIHTFIVCSDGNDWKRALV
jgi:hypothetical protein